MRRRFSALGAATLLACGVAYRGAAQADEAPPLMLYGAGSLREAMGELATAYAAATGRAVRAEFGFSGLMRERIEGGGRADVFASADMGHPLRLLRDGRASRVALFARNALCLAAPAGSGLAEETALDRLLDPSLPLGVFPAVQDPVGDYTLALFHRAGALRPGAQDALRARAAVVSEAMLERPLAPGEDLAAALLRDRRIGLHVTYCTTARNRLARQVPGLEVAVLPEALRVGPEYGLAVLRGASMGAEDFALFVLSPDGQRILARHGFAPVALPAEASPGG